MTMNTGGDIFAGARTDRKLMIICSPRWAAWLLSSSRYLAHQQHTPPVHRARQAHLPHCFVDRHYRLKHFIFNVDKLSASSAISSLSATTAATRSPRDAFSCRTYGGQAVTVPVRSPPRGIVDIRAIQMSNNVNDAGKASALLTSR